MKCRDAKKEIAVMGANISEDTLNHIKSCKKCALEFKATKELDHFLLSGEDLETPASLKISILQSLNQSPGKKRIGILDYVFKTVAISLLLVLGFWLGLTTANNNDYQVEEYPEVIDIPAYSVNTVPLNPDNLGNLYFEILGEASNEKQ